MRSTLEVISGRFEHAVFTTYSLNLHFFEQWVLPLLRKAEVRNVVVLADHRQLGQALADKAIRAAGRSYHAASIRIGPGAFHPKLTLLSGEAGSRLCVSSANLTVDGQLRNLEDGIVLDSTASAHAHAIQAAADFVRRISAAAPPPAAEAIQAALAAVPPPEGDAEAAVFRFVHNLDRPLIEEFPAGEYVAVTPFADDGRAARALAANGALSVLTDGEKFAAPPSFFQGPWGVEARQFGHRRLHAKAYWTDTPDGGWLLVGSPNLSGPALLETATSANTEVAVVLAPHSPRLAELPGEPWARGSLQQVASRRHVAGEEAEQAHQPAFNAWEDEDAIRVAGVADGVAVQHWDGISWVALGTVVNERVAGFAEVRPYLIRAEVAPGTWAEAVVHRTLQLLRQRIRPRMTSRAADTVTQLPLDMEGVKVLESVISDLYTLAELKDREGGRLVPRTSSSDEGDVPESLTEWMPARPDDEPRVPELFRTSWQGEPDALLALIRSALRLDRIESADDELVADEGLEIGDLEVEPEPLTPDPPPAPEAPQPVVTRYRSALVKLLARGDQFVRIAENPTLADFGFQAVLRLHERLTGLLVKVDEVPQPLIEPAALRKHKFALLKAYLLDRTGRDQQCLATARVHLADCLESRDEWQPYEWEDLEALAYAVCPALLESSEYLAAAAEGSGIDAAAATARLRPYAERADWTGWIVEADTILDDVDFGEAPFPWIRGKDWFDDLDGAPAWRVLGYGAVVGFASMRPFGVLVENGNSRSTHLAHLLIADPKARVVHEAMQRRHDRVWQVRSYRPVEQSTLDRAYRINSEALREADRSSLVLLAQSPVKELVESFLAGSLA